MKCHITVTYEFEVDVDTPLDGSSFPEGIQVEEGLQRFLVAHGVRVERQVERHGRFRRGRIGRAGGANPVPEAMDPEHGPYCPAENSGTPGHFCCFVAGHPGEHEYLREQFRDHLKEPHR